MKDLQCPYCGKEQDVDTNDGDCFEEDVQHQMECVRCSKRFVFSTSIIFHYRPEKANCLNGDEHAWVPTETFPIECTKMVCWTCGEERKPTEEEWKQIKKNRAWRL